MTARNVFINSVLVAIALFCIGAIFKMIHFPYGEFLLISSIVLFTVASLPSLAILARKK